MANVEMLIFSPKYRRNFFFNSIIVLYIYIIFLFTNWGIKINILTLT